MRRFKCGLVLLVFGLALSTAARVEAAPIVGSIGFAGDLVGPIDYATVNAFDILGDAGIVVCIGPCTGEFAPVANGTPVVYHDFAFNPIGVGPTGTGSLTPLWSFGGAGGYAFDLGSVTAINRSPATNSLSLVGFGTLYRTGGGDPTAASWSFTATNAAGSNEFRFAATNATLPDAGSSMLLLGSGLLALAAVRRRFQA